MASIIPKRKANRQTEMKNTTQNRNALPVHSTGGIMKGNDKKAETIEKKGSQENRGEKRCCFREMRLSGVAIRAPPHRPNRRIKPPRCASPCLPFPPSTHKAFASGSTCSRSPPHKDVTCAT